MIYQSTQSDDYLWSLILRGKQKEKKQKTKTYKVPPHFQLSEQKDTSSRK